MSILETVFETTATFNKQGIDGGYHHFGIHPSIAFMYGNKSEDVVNLKFKISDNQIRNHEIDIKDNDYWGFYSFKEANFTLIYPQHFLLDMCFPGGTKAEEDANVGKAYRIEII